MKKKRPKQTPEEIAQDKAVMLKLEERIAYHEAKLKQERAARAAG